MLVLILDTKTAMEGVRDGIDLCIRTLIPSLFPFFVLSGLLTGTLTGRSIRVLRHLGRLCGIPEGAESLLAVGFLGGYPVGAQNVGQAYRSGQLSRNDAERMLAFCNNAGPSFLFGMVGPMFSDGKIPWILWGVHIFSALLTGIITAEKKQISDVSVQPKSVTLTTALERAVKSMALVCGWVVLFRMLLQFLDRWTLWLLPAGAQVLVSGLLELSNGCVGLAAIENEGARFVLAGVMLALGGLSVTMQTASAASGLSLGRYLPGKLVQSCLSFLLCVMLQVLFPAGQRFRCHSLLLSVVMLLTAVFCMILRRNKKISSIPAASGV